MSTTTSERCRFRQCAAPIRWATSAASGRSIPLNADPVEPGTKGALVLIGDTAFSLAPAVTRLAALFDVDEGQAHARAHEEYGWYLAHFATCPFAAKARKRGHR